jgi:hypothetical protein
VTTNEARVMVLGGLWSRKSNGQIASALMWVDKAMQFARSVAKLTELLVKWNFGFFRF